MEPFSAILGLGLSAVGTFMGMSASHEANQAQRAQIEDEQKVEGQRQQVASLLHERNQMQILRNHQRARSMGLEAAATQGAQQGSGIAGAYGQIRGQSGVDLVGENQNWEIGQNVFNLNAQISRHKIDYANAQQDLQTAQGISSLGSSISGASKSFSNIFSGPSNGAPKPFQGNTFNRTGSGWIY